MNPPGWGLHHSVGLPAYLIGVDEFAEQDDPEDFAALIPSSPEVISLISVDSTNAELIRRCAVGSVLPWTVVTASEQSAGRGRLDRNWQSEPDSGLWCSVLVDISGCSAPTWLPLVAGLAVFDACTRLGATVELKWPNDVTANGAKLGGILIESAGVADRWVVGIGINVTRAHFPNSVSLADLCGQAPEIPAVMIEVVNSLHTQIESWRNAGWDTSTPSARYHDVCASIGATVQITRPNEAPFDAEGLGLDEHGHLEIARSGDRREIVIAADVVHATIKPCTPKNS
jgi:BirA family biotin operon repressor/biotin-[acetyl-CoA-carboxylase] ligase